MVKRTKRLKKGIESLKGEIENHLLKLEREVKENKTEAARYHTKEIEKSLIKALEIKMESLGIIDDSVKKLKIRLDKLKKELEN